MVGYRKRNRVLTVVLLTDLAAILAGDANRMLTLFGEPCVVNDPGFDGAAPLDCGQSQVKNFGQNRSD